MVIAQRFKSSFRLPLWLCTLILFLPTPASFAGDTTYQLITMEFAPYNYTENGQIVGISTDIVREILKRVGHPDKIESYPLARAYKKLESEDNIILFSRLRTLQREHRNKWVGPLAPFTLVLYARKNSGIFVANLEDAKKYKIGCSIHSMGHKLLLKQGFTNIEAVANGTVNSIKLEKGRIDLWMTSDLVGIYGAKVNGVDPDQFTITYAFQPSHSLYIGFSKNISDDVVALWQRTLNDLKMEGFYTEVLAKYLSPQ